VAGVEGVTDRISDAMYAVNQIRLTPNTPRQLAAARNYVYTHCPPPWLADVLDAMGLTTEGTDTSE
jgi:hypothetical protein